MIAIKNAELVMRDHLIPIAVLLIEDGIIKAFGEARKLAIPEGCEIIDAEGAYVGPGFVDIHTHSDGRVFFQEDPVTASQHHLKHGTATLLPALYFSMDTAGYVEAIALLREAMNKEECANIGGLYMEGPYLNPKFGCDKESNPWQGPVDKDKYGPVIEAAGDLVKVWALAPERENILEFVLDAKAKNPTVAFSVAHSEASPQQIEALMPYGLKIGTHHTNATGDRPMYPEFQVKVMMNPHPVLIATLFSRLKAASEAGKTFTMILGNPEPDTYIPLAQLINYFQVDCSKVHLFAEDEWADQDGNIAPITYEAGFAHSMIKYLYYQIDPKLRMPMENVHYPTNANIADYS